MIDRSFIDRLLNIFKSITKNHVNSKFLQTKRLHVRSIDNSIVKHHHHKSNIFKVRICKIHLLTFGP